MEKDKKVDIATQLEDMRQKHDIEMRLKEESWRRERDTWRAKDLRIMEKWKAEHLSEVESYKNNFQATIVAGQGALKSSIIINGGASVALLAFIGNLWIYNYNVSSLAYPLRLFVFAVLLGTIASGTTYVSQYLFSVSKKQKDKWQKVGKNVNWLTITFVIASYCLFAYGAWESYKVFINPKEPQKIIQEYEAINNSSLQNNLQVQEKTQTKKDR